ncbi:DUF421 domain-containing protein [Thermopolyspora flexuosa]|jgi:uncharacterized membrane protein YcaP (DUF421 family)|uniref:Uncharacterized protein DUF421 n=1 Tax=Thermopolyspora flexuosa TaxID=103836 RepID=A0A543J496_9ACTN|nr:YetF domain-containing protein [Thermopolyspora flexuosa]PZN13643.1 MAG: hypothetical protein DIU75_22500 [Mycolicibacterium hassiacum]TQM77641.1 uncharacterized protein DUF421 [Thermopolyspora flexuosa]GGM71829.1 DUF421 domain-containing protein [Thermopolyspora flexuosa]
MDAILRAAAIYLALLVIFRISGKRTLAQVTTFDFVLLLVISEATQQALLGEDFSVTMAVLVILTFVTLDRIADYLGWRFPRLGLVIDGAPVVLIERGRPLEDRMRQHQLDLEQILQEARTTQGIRSTDEIDYAILERSGAISVIPRRD